MNIWIFNHYAEPPGGRFSNPVGIARALKKLGHDITFFVSSFDHYTRKETQFSNKKKAWFSLSEYDGVKFYFLKTSPYFNNSSGRLLNMLSYAFAAARLGVRLTDRPDIVIASNPHLFGACAGYYVARRKKAKFFFEVRDLWPQTLIDSGLISDRSLVALILRYGETFLYRAANAIIVIPPFAAEYIRKQGIHEEKITWIPNGVDLSLYQNNTYAVPSETLTFMYVGGFAKYNNVHLIVEAARRLRDAPAGTHTIRFVLYGDGPERDHVRDMIVEYHLESMVELRGSAPKVSLPDIVSEASAFIYVVAGLDVVKKYGISPNKLYDYFAAKRPIIFSSASRNNPVADANAGITVKPDDADALADGIREFLKTSHEERIAMAQRGSHFVQQYDIEALAKQFDTLFRRASTLSS